MNVTIRQIEGLALAARGGTEHWTVMDTDPEFGGHDGAAKPMELILMALGGCSGMDVLSILKKMRVPLDDIEIRLDADQAESPPRVFTAIRMKYILYGKGIDPAKVEQAIDLSKTKYCSAWAMLRKAVAIEHSYEIHPEKDGE